MYNTFEPLIIANNYQPSSSLMGSPITPFDNNKDDNSNNKNNTNNNDEGTRLRSYCFPDNFSTSSGPSVNSYLRNIYGDSVSSSNANSRMNSNNYNRNRSNTTNSYYNNFRIIPDREELELDDNATSTTMDPEERKILVNHLNEYSFETLRENSEDSNKQNEQTEDKTIAKHSTVIDETNSAICPRTPSPAKFNNRRNISSASSTNDIQGLPCNNSPFNNNLNIPMRRCSIVPPQQSPSSIYSNKKISHRKSNAISLSQEFDGFHIDDTVLTPKEKLEQKNIKIVTPFERFKDIYMDDDDSPISPLSYPHHTSPIKTINNTNEQIKRNQSGKFDSLNDFANFNNIKIEGKKFVGRPTTPKINLEANFLPL
ncbi:hypothetical protein MOUN0_L04764 [Monosporozyma unispora]|nr:autophagy protein 6 [Kazachstania unispora]